MKAEKSHRRKGPPRRENKILGQMIRETRQKARLTQDMVAYWLGREHSYLSRVESAQQVIDLAALKDLLQVLNVDFTDFMHEFQERCETELYASVPLA